MILTGVDLQQPAIDGRGGASAGEARPNFARMVDLLASFSSFFLALLVTRTLLVAPGLTTKNKKILVAICY